MKTFNIAPGLTTINRSVSRAIAPFLTRWATRSKHILEHLLHAIVDNSEPHVWQQSDRNGNLCWHGYDPVTETHVVGSEMDMRVWIEQRYYP